LIAEYEKRLRELEAQKNQEFQNMQ